MPNYITLSRGGQHLSIPDFTEDPTDVLKNVTISSNNEWLGGTIYTFAGTRKTHSAFVRNLQTNAVFRVTGHQTKESSEVSLQFDPTSKFGCFIDNTRALFLFDCVANRLIKVNIPTAYRLYRWVGSVFDPVRTLLYVAYVKEESGAYDAKESGIVVINLLTMAIDTEIAINGVFRNENGYQLATHCKLTITHNGSHLIIPNVNSSTVCYDLVNQTYVNLGYSDNEKFLLGLQSRTLIVKPVIGKPSCLNYPSLKQRTVPDELTNITYSDIKNQTGVPAEQMYTYTEQASLQYINSFDALNFSPVIYLYDPATKLPVCFKPTLVNLTTLGDVGRPKSILELYRKICANNGLDADVVITDLNTDDTCHIRTTVATPFNTLDYTSPAAASFTVSADSGFGLYLRRLTQSTSYMTSVYGRKDEALMRASFTTTKPPFLLFNSKQKDWDVKILEYREQKSSLYTVAMLKYQEIYGNYSGTREILLWIGSNGRLDFAISPDPSGLSKARCLVFDETDNQKYVTSLFGGFTDDSDQTSIKWYSNAIKLNIDPLSIF